MGYVGQTPELNRLKNGEEFVQFSVATSTKFTSKETGEIVKNVEWHPCSAFGKLAGIIGKYVKKGNKIYLEGKIKTSKYTDRKGIDRYKTQIIVNEISMLNDKSDDTDSKSDSNQSSIEPSSSCFDDDIPF